MIKIKYRSENKEKTGIFDVRNRKEFALKKGIIEAMHSTAIDNGRFAMVSLIIIIVTVVIFYFGSFSGALLVFSVGAYILQDLYNDQNNKIKIYNNSTVQP